MNFHWPGKDFRGPILIFPLYLTLPSFIYFPRGPGTPLGAGPPLFGGPFWSQDRFIGAPFLSSPRGGKSKVLRAKGFAENGCAGPGFGTCAGPERGLLGSGSGVTGNNRVGGDTPPYIKNGGEFRGGPPISTNWSPGSRGGNVIGGPQNEE